MADRDQSAMFYATLLYLNNTSAPEYFKDVYGDDRDESYRSEKTTAWSQSPGRALGSLAPEDLDRVADIVLSRYGDKGRERAEKRK